MLQALELVRADLQEKARWCYEDGSWRGVLKALASDGSASMVVYRAMQAARRHHIPALEMLFNKINSGLLSCTIGRGAEFGPGFVLIHSNGVVINGAVVGGSRVHIEHQVTIGAERRQSPRLGDDVFLGAGAKVIGPVTLGDRVRVGANAVVTKDVASGHTVVGVPAKPIRPSGGEAPSP